MDKFKSAYDEFKVPYPDDTLSAKVDEQWKTLEPEIKKFCEERQKDIQAYDFFIIFILLCMSNKIAS